MTLSEQRITTATPAETQPTGRVFKAVLLGATALLALEASILVSHDAAADAHDRNTDFYQACGRGDAVISILGHDLPLLPEHTYDYLATHRTGQALAKACAPARER